MGCSAGTPGKPSQDIVNQLKKGRNELVVAERLKVKEENELKKMEQQAGAAKAKAKAKAKAQAKAAPTGVKPDATKSATVEAEAEKDLQKRIDSKKTDLRKAEQSKGNKEWEVQILEAKVEQSAAFSSRDQAEVKFMQQQRKAPTDAAAASTAATPASASTAGANGVNGAKAPAKPPPAPTPRDVAKTRELESEYEAAKAVVQQKDYGVENAEKMKALFDRKEDVKSAEAEVRDVEFKLAAEPSAPHESALLQAKNRLSDAQKEEKVQKANAAVSSAKMRRYGKEAALKKAEAALKVPEAMLQAKPATVDVQNKRKDIERQKKELKDSVDQAEKAEQEYKNMLKPSNVMAGEGGDDIKRQQSAQKIQALQRGIKARKEVDTVRAECACADGAILDPKPFGFAVANTSEDMPDIPDDLRYAVRDETSARVLMQLGFDHGRGGRVPRFEDGVKSLLRDWNRLPMNLPTPVIEQLKMCHLFTSPLSTGTSSGGKDESANFQRAPSSDASAKRKYLLGKFDCLAIPVVADYDAHFCRLSKNTGGKNASQNPSGTQYAEEWSEPVHKDAAAGWFYIFHAAAINIGEFAEAEDFDDYSTEVADEADYGNPTVRRKSKVLNAPQYLDDMYQVFKSTLTSMAALGCEDAVLFPFGMGAFLRNLKKNDSAFYDDDKLYELKIGVAGKFMDAIVDVILSGKSTLKRAHLCLVNTSVESVANHNAFIRAAASRAKDSPALSGIVYMHQNTDALEVAHSLAMISGKPLSVALLNGCNRKLMGDHWFTHGARLAIDENLHRRSSLMGRVALLLNKGTWPINRAQTDLADHVKFFGGRVSMVGAPLAAAEPAAKAAPAPTAPTASAAKAQAKTAAKK